MRHRHQIQKFAGVPFISDHTKAKAFAFGPKADYSDAPAQQHRSRYTEADAQAVVDWRNTEFVGEPVGELKTPPRVVAPHNHPVRSRPRWRLVFHQKGTNGIFQPTSGHGKAVRGANEGWTSEDIVSFGRYLAGLEGSHP